VPRPASALQPAARKRKTPEKQGFSNRHRILSEKALERVKGIEPASRPVEFVHELWFGAEQVSP